MDIVEAHREFDVFLDKIASEEFPELLTEEKDLYLNEAQDRFVKTRYGRNNAYRQGFEEMQKRTEDLKNLVVTKFAGIQDSVYSGLGTPKPIRQADLSSLFNDEGRTEAYDGEYMFYLKSQVRVCRTDTAAECCKWDEIKLVQQDDVSRITGDPFNKPDLNNTVTFFEGDGIMIWTGENVEADNFLVTFIKRPVRVVNDTDDPNNNVTFELSEHTHKEIIQMAVTIALENLGSPRVESQIVVNESKSE